MALRSGSAARPNSAARFPEGGNVTADQRAIDRNTVAAAAVETDSQFNVPARDFFLHRAAQLHLEGIHLRRDAEMQIEEAVIYRLQRNREVRMPRAVPVTCA